MVYINHLFFKGYVFKFILNHFVFSSENKLFEHTDKIKKMYLSKKLNAINQAYIFPISIYDFFPTSMQITNTASVELLGFKIEKILKLLF